MPEQYRLGASGPGQATVSTVTERLESDEPREVIDPSVHLPSRHAVESRSNAQVLSNGQERIEQRRLEDRSDRGTDGVRFCDHAPPIDADLAGGRHQRRRDARDRRALPHAVRAEESEQRTGRHRERQILYRCKAAVVLPQMVGLNGHAVFSTA